MPLRGVMPPAAASGESDGEGKKVCEQTEEDAEEVERGDDEDTALDGAVEAAEEGKLCVTGQLRSFNNRRGEWAKLVITVFAKELCLCREEDSNFVQLSGTLCKAPNLRTTPMGRDICDLMLAVNRHYGRSDYLPCICWGLRAREAAQWGVGTKLQLEGRIQSRRYIKLTEEGPLEKTAFEVSVTDIHELVPEASIL